MENAEADPSLRLPHEPVGFTGPQNAPFRMTRTLAMVRKERGFEQDGIRVKL